MNEHWPAQRIGVRGNGRVPIWKEGNGQADGGFQRLFFQETRGTGWHKPVIPMCGMGLRHLHCVAAAASDKRTSKVSIIIKTDEEAAPRISRAALARKLAEDTCSAAVTSIGF